MGFLRKSALLVSCLTAALSLLGQQEEPCHVSPPDESPEATIARAQLEQEVQRQMRILEGRKKIEETYGPLVAMGPVEEKIFDVRVVFHAVGTQDFLNRVTRSTVNTLVNETNDFFSGAAQNRVSNDLPPSVLAVAAGDTDIRFHLARVAPPGKSFTPGVVGLTKRLSSKRSWSWAGMVAYFDRLKWPTEKYVNVFLIEATRGGHLGQARRSTPSEPGFAFVVLGARFGLTAHEIGHYLSLQHPWGLTESTECRDWDGIDDTPFQNEPIYSRTCRDDGGNTLNTYQCRGHRAMVENVMGYARCRSMFTRGQKTRMRALLSYDSYTLLHVETLHVNASAPAGGDGRSWSSAFQDLESALAKIRTRSSSGWNIEMATGTYTPSKGTGREKTFLIDQKVRLVGGFSPDGAVQDPIKYPTILSGDLSRDDLIGDPKDPSDNQQQNENAYHVLTLSATGKITLENITVEKGIANGTREEQSHGGGIWVKESATELHMKNLILQHNQARTNGGGMYISGSTLSMDIQNITVRYNRAQQGGGSYLDEVSNNGNLFLKQGSWHDNHASEKGGGLYLNGQAVMVNVLFWQNQAKKGGGIYLKKTLKMAQTTFFANRGTIHGAAIYLDETTSEHTLIANTLFYKNTGPSAWYNEVSSGEGPQVAHSYFKTGTQALKGVTNQRLRHNNLAKGTDPGLVSEIPEDGPNFLRPLPNSLLKNKGSAAFVIGGKKFTPEDILKGFYHRRWAGNDTEIGACAYEKRTWYVKHDAEPNENTDGASWQRAISLPKALEKAAYGEEIWLRKGTYDITATAQTREAQQLSTFSVPSGLRLYGGFSGTETDLSQRNPDRHSAILSGKNIAHHVVTIPQRSEKVWLHGLTIERGNANGTQDKHQRGAGLYIEGEAILVKVSVRHHAAQRGAGLWVGGSAFVDENCDIHHNIASEHGGGIAVDERGMLHAFGATVRNNQGLRGVGLYNAGAAILVRSQFKDNPARTNTYGAGIYNSGYLYMLSCTLSGNGNSRANNTKGGGIYLTGNKTTKLLNLTLMQNVASAQGGGIYIDSTVSDDALIANSVLTGNTKGDSQTPNDIYNAKIQGQGLRLSHSFLTDIDRSLTGSENHVLRSTALLEGNPQLALSLPPRTGSPLINQGNNDLLREARFSERQSAGDLGGKVRIQNGRIDIGAREVGDANVSLTSLSTTLPTTLKPTFYFFWPEKGTTNSSVTLLGRYFAPRAEDNIVTFGDAQAVVEPTSNRQLLSVRVPNLTPGQYTLTLSATGANPTSHSLKYTLHPQTPTPTFTSFLPASGPKGTQVTLQGTQFSANPNDNEVRFGNTQAVANSVNNERTQLKVSVPDLSPGEYAIRLTLGQTQLTHETKFVVSAPPNPPPTPTFTSFLPASGHRGTQVTLQGTQFSANPNDNEVRFGNAQAVANSVNNERTQLRVSVPDLSPGEYAIRLTLGQTQLTHETKFVVSASPNPPPTPTFTSFLPARGHRGTQVTLQGTQFSAIPNDNEVRFGNTPAVANSVNNERTQLKVSVPDLSPGEYAIQLTLGQTQLTHETKFVVSASPNPPPTPTFTSFLPTSGHRGTQVTLQGTQFSAIPSDNEVRFGNTPAVANSVNGERTQLRVSVPDLSPGEYAIRLTLGQTQLTHETKFVVSAPPTPTFTSFLPASGHRGTQVTLQGTQFSAIPNDNEVRFGNTQAVANSVNNERTQLRVSVPDLSPGEYAIRLTLGQTQLTHETKFVVSAPPAPTFTSFLPTNGHRGTQVTLQGTQFSANPSDNEVRFDNTPAVANSVNSERTQLKVSVPDLSPGEYAIRLTLGQTQLTHETKFVVPVPTFTSFLPASGPKGTQVTLQGAQFSAILNDNKVRFGSTHAVTNSVNSERTQLRVSVPDLSPGEYAIRLTLGQTQLTHETKFVVPVPTFTSFLPASGPKGTQVTLQGTQFSALPSENKVLFGYVSVEVARVNDERTQLRVVVPDLRPGAYPIRLTIGQTVLRHETPFVVKNLTTTPKLRATANAQGWPRPNPTQGLLWVGPSFISGQLWSTSGALKRTWLQPQTQLDLSDLARGLYILQWKTDAGQRFQTCIVKY